MYLLDIFYFSILENFWRNSKELIKYDKIEANLSQKKYISEISKGNIGIWVQWPQVGFLYGEETLLLGDDIFFRRWK